MSGFIAKQRSLPDNRWIEKTLFMTFNIGNPRRNLGEIFFFTFLFQILYLE